jgi:hypothetical protein
MTSYREVKPSIGELLQRFKDPVFKEANQQANAETISRMKRSSPVVIGIGQAKDHIPGMRENLVLHAGPPNSWNKASGAMKGAIIGGLLFEGLAKSKEEAVAMMEKGEVDLEPCHDHDAVGPMAGITTWSMPVYIIEDLVSGQRTYSNISDDLGDYMGASVRFGVYEKPAIDHLHWVKDTLGPILNEVIEDVGPIDLLPIIGKGLLLGDDCHVAMTATTPMFLRVLMPGLIRACKDQDTLLKITELIHCDELFTLNPIMATCKALSIAGSNVDNSSIVTVMARNGTEFGIKVSGLGDRWFTGLAEIGRGFLMPGLSPADIGRDMGDSAITETLGLGGTARSISGGFKDATGTTTQLYGITQSESDFFRIPALEGRGSPMGFDILKIIEKKIRPAVNSGLANRQMNRPAAGVGFLHPPMEAFVDAAIAFSQLDP